VKRQQGTNSKGESWRNTTVTMDTASNMANKDSTWLQYFGHSNSLCTQASRAIVNHASMGEYRLRFFPNEDFSYSCGNYPIESRRYILHKYQRFNKYWNLRRDSIGHFVFFLIFNSSAFIFSNSSI